MALNDVNKNYTLGRGKLNFAQFRAGTVSPRGERYLGNSPELSFSASQDTLDHYSSDGGIRLKDASVILQQDYTGAFTLDDVNMPNMAMFFLGDARTLTSSALAVTGETFTDIEKGVSYQLGTTAANPSGVRQVSAVVVKKVGVTAPLVAGTDYVVDLVTARVTLLAGSTVLAYGNSITVDYQITASTRDQVISKGKTIEGALRYIAQNPAGANVDYFMPWVKISPNGDFNLKGDDWQAISYNIEILKKGDLEAIYADGRPFNTTVTPPAPVMTKLLSGSQMNTVPINVIPTGLTGSLLGHGFAWPHLFPKGNGNGIQIRLDNAFFRDTRDGLSKTTGNVLKIPKMALQANGISVPITFNGGARNITLADGAYDILSDFIPASAWNLTQITVDTPMYLKGLIVNDAAVLFPYTTRETGQSPALNGTPSARSFVFDPATTAANQIDVDAMGDFGFSAGAAGNLIVGFCPMILAKFNDLTTPSLITRGTSIPAGASGVSGFYTTGVGYMNKLARDLKIGHINMAVGGSRFIDGTGDDRFMSLLKYGTTCYYHHGENNFEPGGTITPAQGIDFVVAANAAHKAAGIKKTVFACLMPRTSSTDNWATPTAAAATPDNQTILGNDANRLSFNTLLKARTDLDAVVPMVAIRNSQNPQKWKENTAADEVHENNTGAALTAAEVRAVLEPLLAA